MSVYEKMTALADAVREKADLTTSLTIDAMTAAVSALSVGSGTDTSDATADASHLLEGKTAYTKTGKITGSMAGKGAFSVRVDPSNDNASGGPGYYSSVNVSTAVTARNFTPSTEQQEYDGYEEGAFLSQVTVFPIPSEYIVTGDATAGASDICTGKTAYVRGRKVEGALPEMETPSFEGGEVVFQEGFTRGGKFPIPEAPEPAVSGPYVEIPEGYHKARTVSVRVMDILSASKNIVAIPEGYNFFPYEITVGTAKDAEIFTPGTKDITLAADTYLSGDQVIKGDPDLTAGNIKTGVSLFGVEGTFTADATAVSGDIANGKTAYVKGQKVTGSRTGEGYYKCSATNHALKMWVGYKAEFVNGFYEISKTNFANNLVANGFTPVVGEIYNADTTVHVQALFQKTDESLVFHAPLATSKRTAETGQSITYTNCTFVTHKGISCMRCDDGYSTAESDVPNIPVGNSERTISFWGCPDSHTDDWMGFFVYGSDAVDRMVCVRTNNDNAGFGFAWNDHDSDVNVANQWHHFALTYDASGARLFVDGNEVLHVDVDLDTAYSSLKIGAGVNPQTGYCGFLADFRIYSRALNSSEIQDLAAELTPVE